MRECYNIVQLLSPASLVQQRFVARVFTRVAVKPPLLRLRIHFRPHVVSPVQHVTRFKAYSTAAEREAIRPLATPSSAGFCRWEREGFNQLNCVEHRKIGRKLTFALWLSLHGTILLQFLTARSVNKLAPLFQPAVKQNRNQSRLAYAHFPALYADYIHVIVLYSDWLIAPFVTVVIGQNNYTQLKSALYSWLT